MKRLFLLLLLCSSAYAGVAQCTPNVYGISSFLLAPTAQGATASLTSNMRADSYVEVHMLVIGYEYQMTSSVYTDYFTVRSGTPDGPVVAYGPQPLNFVASVSGTYYMHLNSDANCSKVAGGVAHYSSITLVTPTSTPAGCYQNSGVFTSMTAPAADNGTSSTQLMQAGAYTQLYSVVAGNTYTITSTIATDYISVRSGIPRGAIVVAGTQPVTFTAPIGGTYYVHLNTDVYCGASGTGRRLTTTRIYPDCNGTPTPGKAVTSNAGPVCPNASFTLSVDGTLEAKGITYQWQVSTTGESGPFTNIDGKTSATAVITGQAQSSWYRLAANCTISNQSAVSAAVNVEQATNTTFYKDFDNDGFGDATQSTTECSATAPTGYVSDNTDCYDNDASLNPNTIWYLDFDSDGYYTGIGIKSCLPPIEKGYKHAGLTGGNDCDDNNIDIHEPVQYYVDGDLDGYGSTTTVLVCSPTATTGYSTNSTDCNDGDATIHAGITYYGDTDQDGYGDPNSSKVVCSIIPPTGYSINNLDCDDTRRLYADLDGDGFGAGGSQACGVASPADCDDTNPNLNTPKTYFIDVDGDGFGNPQVTTTACSTTPPEGYVDNGSDCNDGDRTINRPVLYFRDFDSDGYGYFYSGSWECSATPPSGYVTNSTDCDDQNAAIHAGVQYYIDGDGDGFGSVATETLCVSTPPAGYSTNNTDCNDGDETILAPQFYYVDGDGDGYGSTKSAMLCFATTGYVTNNTDCDDNNAAVHTSQQYYVDADGDGYGSSIIALRCEATAPAGYSTNNTDCNDNDAAINTPQQYYVDSDQDGYGSTITNLVCSSTATRGYSTNNTDCNDANGSVHAPAQYYVDGDHDGYGSTATVMLCESTAPVGYATNSTDCNDADANAQATQQYYVDNDRDGYGSTASEMLCASSAPVGFATNNTDCNDADATSNTTKEYYVDGDRDGYGSTTTAMLCAATAPVGYSTNNTDCNDNDAAIYANCGPCKNAAGLTITNITTTSATLNWVANSNPALWQVEYKSTNQGAKWVAVLLPGTARSYTLVGLKANQNYQWHIRAKCGTKWTGYSNTISFKTKPTILSGAPINRVTLGLEREAQVLEVKVLPNPSTTFFTLLIRSSSDKSLSLRIVDAVGRTVESRNGVAANSTQRVGHNYVPGVYFVQVLQDGKLVTLKLMKQAQ